jgi:hypothetical protein
VTYERKDVVQVGAVAIPLDLAIDWLRMYTSSGQSAASPYAYPAYDQYECGNNDPLRLRDADLLAPVLLNVAPKIRSYYGLQRVRPHLERCLAVKDLAQPLAELDDNQISAAVGTLYSVLDDPNLAPPGVRGTTLSKIVHRKRPQALVLHDKWIRRCYVGGGGPVPLTAKRTWADYMVQVTNAIRDDIRYQPDQFAALASGTPRPGELTPVRILDIIAWTSRGRQPT